MATEIVMPQMGAEMEEGTVLKWLKQPGDSVAKGDIIAAVRATLPGATADYRQE